MSNLTGFPQVYSGDTSQVDSTQQHPLGTWAMDENGNIYIYLKGVANTAAGSWVVFDEDHNTSLASANAKGRVAIAMAAIGANQYGWYQIYGKNTIAKALTGCAADVVLFLTSTAGSVDDANVAGDDILNAISRSAESSGVITVELNFPFVDDVDRIA